MDGAVNYRFKSVTKLVIMTRTGGFRSCDPQHVLRKKVSPRFSYSDWTKSRLFFKRDKAARHKCTIGCPGRYHIGYLVDKSFNISTKFLLSSPNFKIHPCRASESVPPGPELPKSFRANDSTSVMFTGIKIVFSSYASNVEPVGIFLYGCYPPVHMRRFH